MIQAKPASKSEMHVASHVCKRRIPKVNPQNAQCRSGWALGILPSLLLLRTESKQCPIASLLPRNFHDEESYKVRKSPVTTMGAQHIKILDIERATPAGEVVIDLTVVVEKGHALLGDFLAGEIVCFHFDV